MVIEKHHWKNLVTKTKNKAQKREQKHTFLKDKIKRLVEHHNMLQNWSLLDDRELAEGLGNERNDQVRNETRKGNFALVLRIPLLRVLVLHGFFLCRWFGFFWK
jgi:hypothetical protein